MGMISEWIWMREERREGVNRAKVRSERKFEVAVGGAIQAH